MMSSSFRIQFTGFTHLEKKKGRKWIAKIVYRNGFKVNASPPGQLGSAACRPPEPPWPMEAHLSSEPTAQSAVQTGMGTFNLK